MATILAVDDHLTNREILIAMLQSRGHRLFEAGDGREALALARAEHLDLIISDILMPTMDGYELARQLRGDKTTASIPVIFYSAHYLRDEARKLAESCGVSAILTKPAEPETILRTVDAALGMASTPQAPAAGQEFDRQHLQVLTNKLAKTTNELSALHQRLMMMLTELNPHISSSIEPSRIREFQGENRRLVIELQQRTTALEQEVVEHQRAQEDLAERAAMAALVADIGVTLTRGGTLSAILQHCTEALVQRLEAAFARIWTLNEEENVLELQASAGLDTHLDGPHSRIPLGHTEIGLIAADRVPRLTNSVIGNPQVSDQDWATREGIVAFAGYPLLVGEQVVGVVAMFARRPFTAFSLDALDSVADLVALGIQRERAALAQAEEAQVSAALARVGREMISSLETPIILDRLCRLTTEVLACDASCTLLWRPEDNLLESIAAFSASGEEEEILRVLRLPKSALPVPLSALVSSDIIPIGAMLPRDVRAPAAPAPVQLGIVLRQGADLIGLQVAYWRNQPEPLATVAQRIAPGIAQIASWALAHARVIEELGHANRLKADFVSTMSHELRTPLTAIIGYNDLLLEGAFGMVPVEQRHILAKVHESSRHLLDLVTATLDLSRLEKGALPLETTEIALRELITLLETETAALRREKPEVQFVSRMKSKRPHLRTDAVKLAIVLRNLIGNAFKFTEAGHVSLVVADRGDGIEFAVSDTGIGIAPERHGLIFEAFRQVEPYLTRRHGGIGLGLYVVHRLVEVLRGTVRVTSEVGRGSTFRVWLPLDIGSPSTRRDVPSARLNSVG